MAGKAESVVGVDFSAWMLRKAKLKLEKKTNVDLVCADFDYLPFLEGWFTHIFMFNALPDPAYWDHAIREALRVLRIEGGISLSVPNRAIRIRKLGSSNHNCCREHFKQITLGLFWRASLRRGVNA